MKPMDILDALGSVDEALLLHSEQPLALRRGRVGNGVKIAIAAALLLAVGLGGFWLLRSGAHVASQPPEYTLPTLEPQKPTDPPLLPVTPIAYSTNWEALDAVWCEECDLLAVTNGIRTQHAVTYYGDVPEKFRKLIRSNLLYASTVCDHRIVKYCQADLLQGVAVYNDLGTELARCMQPCDDEHSVCCATTTSDGGFLFALGFRAQADGSPVSYETGGSSTVIKCGEDGSVQWTRELEGVGADMLSACFDADGAYCFFGTQDASSESDARGLYLLCLNADGSVREQRVLDDVGVDRLRCAVQDANGFALYAETSSDGRLPWETHYLVRLDTALNVLSVEPTGFGSDIRCLGLVDGEPLLSGDARLANFPYGSPLAVLDYGDRLLTASFLKSSNPSGLPAAARPSLILYAAFDKKDGTLLWRAATHASSGSSPAESDASPLPQQDEAELPLDWLVRVPDLNEESSPEERAAYVDAMKELYGEIFQSLLKQDREELELVAEQMLRLQAQSGEPQMPTTYFTPEDGLRCDPSAGADMDTAELSARLQALATRGNFQMIVVEPFHYFVDEDTCDFKQSAIHEKGGQLMISLDLCYCADPHPEQTPYEDKTAELLRLDEHWYLLYQASWVEN